MVNASTGIFQDTTALGLKHLNFNLNLGAKYFINKKIAIHIGLISEFKDVLYNAFGNLTSSNHNNNKNIPSSYFGISIGSSYRFSDLLKN